MPNHGDKSIEQWLWDAACSIRSVKDAPKYKDDIFPRLSISSVIVWLSYSRSR